MEYNMLQTIVQNYYGETVCERLTDENNHLLFLVANLCETPEDAIIGRGLFCAENYIQAVELGMKLAQQGYTSIKCTITEETNYDGII